jgi:hypothetical protein
MGRNWSVSTKVLVADDVRVVHYEAEPHATLFMADGGVEFHQFHHHDRTAGKPRVHSASPFSASSPLSRWGTPQGSTKLRAAAKI